jgi:hypothetical protein
MNVAEEADPKYGADWWFRLFFREIEVRRHGVAHRASYRGRASRDVLCASEPGFFPETTFARSSWRPCAQTKVGNLGQIGPTTLTD